MKLQPNFKYPEITDEHYVFGKQIQGAALLRPDGDWRPYTPPEEAQRRNGVESSSCFVEAQQHALATILEEQFDVVDQNFSARFNLIYSDATSSGGDPLKAAQSFRDRGLVPDTFLPFSDDIKSWEEFRSFKGGNRDDCEKQGKTWRSYWEPKYDVVVRKEMDVEGKYNLMKQALKFSPLPMSVAQGYDNGQPKPKGARDIHLVELVYIDDQNRPYIWDTYAPYLKCLAPNYNTEFVMRWTLEKQATKDEINGFMAILRKMLEALNLIAKKPVIAPVLPPVSPATPILPIPSKYDWDTPILARHSVRVIADEEGLNVEQKNTMCATIGGESGWNPKAKNENRDRNGKLLSTDWGICQINDYYHIGLGMILGAIVPSYFGRAVIGSAFPSVDYVLKNPEACVRWMCTQWKAGHRTWWIAYKNGSYKKYL